jgi:ADP-heptose:LPS heptosyltransferase
VTRAEDVAAALAALGLTQERPVLVICPGAEFGDAKQWPAEHFASVCAQRITSMCGSSVNRVRPNGQ